MYRVMNKLRSDKRGFTLTELLVTMTILLIALTLTVSLAGVIWRNYRLVEYRWIVQTAVEYVAGCFQREAHNEAFATANYADLYYEPKDPTPGTSFSFACAPELGTITMRDDYSLVFNTMALSDELKKQIHDENSIYLLVIGDHFYNVHYSSLYHTVSEGPPAVYEYADGTSTDASAFRPVYPLATQIDLVEPSVADVKITIDFSIAGNVLDYDTTTHDESKTEDHTSYIPTAVTTEIHGTVVSVNDATLKSETTISQSIDLVNMDKNSKVNYTNGQLSSTYVAGWDKGNITGYPDSLNIPTEGGGTVTVSNPSAKANIVKYHSFNTPKKVYESGTSDDFWHVNVDMPVCLLTSLTIGSDRQTQILEPIRDFRDNVLRGNAVGEWVIDKYYDWSPTVIGWTEKSPALKSTLRFAAEGLALVATVAVE